MRSCACSRDLRCRDSLLPPTSTSEKPYQHHKYHKSLFSLDFTDKDGRFYFACSCDPARVVAIFCQESACTCDRQNACTCDPPTESYVAAVVVDDDEGDDDDDDGDGDGDGDGDNDGGNRIDNENDEGGDDSDDDLDEQDDDDDDDDDDGHDDNDDVGVRDGFGATREMI